MGLTQLIGEAWLMSLSLRASMAIVISLLLLAFAAAQWWLLERATTQLREAYGRSAFQLSRQTAEAVLNARHGLIAEQQAAGSASLWSTAPGTISLYLQDKASATSIRLTVDGHSRLLELPRQQFDDGLLRLQNDALILLMAILAIALLLTFLTLSVLTAPLSRLQQASRQLATGKLGVQVATSGAWVAQEIRAMIDGFNKMSSQLKRLQLNNEKLRQTRQREDYQKVAQSLAHALRNPLNTLNLSLDQLMVEGARADLCALGKRQVARIEHWLQQLTRLLREPGVERQKQSIDELLQQARQQCQSPQRVQLQVDESVAAQLIEVMVDEVVLVLVSILDNALEADASGQPVTLAAEIKGDRLHLQILDRGPGFSEAVLDRLFEPHNTDKSQGSGMGLYLARQLVRANYDGDVRVSNQSRGCAVSVVLRGVIR